LAHLSRHFGNSDEFVARDSVTLLVLGARDGLDFRKDRMPSKKKSRGRHQPKGQIILHEDRDILVVDKAPGLLTMGTSREKVKTAY